jgi:hypothetical protein
MRAFRMARVYEGFYRRVTEVFLRTKSSQFQIYAVILCLMWAALGTYIAFTGHMLAGIALPVVFGPLTYMLFTFFDVSNENTRNTFVVDNLRNIMNKRVGVFTIEDMMAFEYKFNMERPENMIHKVDKEEANGEVIVHVVHFSMDNEKPEWNSEVLMRFNSEDRKLISWEMRLAKGAAKFTDDPKTREEKDADVIYGP